MMKRGSSNVSEISAHGFSRGSSLSIFSGVASTGSVSDIRGFGSAGGGSSGHVNVDDLNDEELNVVIEDLKVTVRRLLLETQMFQGYYERLARGAPDLPGADPNASQVGSRKGSTSMTIDSMSETDSQPPTSGTALMNF